MKLQAIYNKGFEDFLTNKNYYQIISETLHGYITICDKGFEMEFDKCRFRKKDENTKTLLPVVITK